MKDFVLPFRPEELLAKPGDGRLWASDPPPVDEWSVADINRQLDALVGRLLASHGRDVTEENSFCFLFALLQAWPRLEEHLQHRVVDLLVDASARLQSDAGRLRKSEKASAGPKSPSRLSKGAELKESKEQQKDAHKARMACKVVVFMLKWAAERLMLPPSTEGGSKVPRRGRKAAVQGEAASAAAEQAKEAQKAFERLRCSVLSSIMALLKNGSMPWLWMKDLGGWQQVAQAVSDAGFHIGAVLETLKQKELKNLALSCIAEPLLQEGHQHSNLLVATVSKLMHALRSGEAFGPFVADALSLAHATPLPRLLLVDVMQVCTGQELSAQGGFQRSLASFLAAVSERLPHLVLANISVILPLLDVDCYPLRIAVVESIGALLKAEGRTLPRGAHVVAEPLGEGDEEGDGGRAPAASSDAGPVKFSIASSTRKDLLETLLTRSIDKSVWVRYRVLQTLSSLATAESQGGLPRELWSKVLEIATKRLQDHATMTRKASMQLVRGLIEHHPYGPALQGSGDERTKAEQLVLEVQKRLRKLQEEEAEELEGGVELPEETEGPADRHSKRRRMSSKVASEDTIKTAIEQDLAAETEGAEGGSQEEKRKQQREALIRMQECYAQRVHFVELMDAVEPRIRTLLASKTPTDVTEAISVVMELRIRGVPAAAGALDQVLGLVWSRHTNVKDAAVDAFHKMYLEGRTKDVEPLLKVYEDGLARGTWTYTHLASMQELIHQAADKGILNPQELLPGLLAALKGAACAQAVRVLTALVASPGTCTALGKNLKQLAEVLAEAPNRTPERSLELVRLLCQLLQRLHACADNHVDRSQIWSIGQQAIILVIKHFSSGEVPPQWFSAAQASMDLSFELAGVIPATCCPDKLWEQTLGCMARGLLGVSPEAVAAATAVPLTQGEEGAEAEEAPVEEKPTEDREVASLQLACVVFLAGHLGLRMLTFLEGLQSGLKKRRMVEEEARISEQREANKKKASKKGKDGKEAKEEEDGHGAAEAMGMAGQEEREAEAFADLAEHGLLFSKLSFLDRLKPLVFNCLLESKLRNDVVLRRVAAISLCKFMTVSKKFCKDNLKLLFSVLFPVQSSSADADAEAAADAAEAASKGGAAALLEDLTLRQSLLVALGDLLFRHPNTVDPWTRRLYATLSSPAGEAEGQCDAAIVELRLTALLVLTHLVLNDMMKPRTDLLVRALWLTDCAHDPTARVARILFQELSKRTTNVIYNLLPEIVARMPQYHPPGSLEGGRAEERVRYLMQFIEKEKQIEGLIEKLSVRLEQCANSAGGHAGTGGETPIEDELVLPEATQVDTSCAAALAQLSVNCLGTALASMNYTDRCILRLHDTVVTRKALNTAISYHPSVQESFLALIDKTRKARLGKEKGGEPGDVEMAPADGAPAKGPKAGMSTAAVEALDAIEQAIQGLSKGKSEQPEVVAEEPEPIPIERPPAPQEEEGKKKRKPKRKNQE